MRVDVIPNVTESKFVEFVNRTVIVVDVFRATSCIVTALKYGVRSVVPVETVAQAKQRKQPDDLLGGERFCRKITGFDIGNSPAELMRTDLADKRLVMTTTNGTRAIQKAQKAENILAGSFLNARSCGRAALELKRDVVILCAGTQDQFSLEDGLCAGLIIHEMEQERLSLEKDDFGTAMLYTYRQAEEHVHETLKSCKNGKKLHKLGYDEDVEFCARRNLYSVVPRLRQGEMTALSGF